MELNLNLEPIACPRPRISKWGAYYPAAYTAWKKKAAKVVRDAVAGISGYQPFTDPIVVTLRFIVQKPKKTKLAVPRPDIDNYIKSIFDACNTIVWSDDTLVVRVDAVKGWSGQHEPGIYMTVELDAKRIELPSARTVSEVRKQGRSGPL